MAYPQRGTVHPLQPVPERIQQLTSTLLVNLGWLIAALHAGN